MPTRNDLLDCLVGLILRLKKQPVVLTPRQTKELVDRIYDMDELWCETNWMYEHRCCRLDAWNLISSEMGIDIITAMEQYRAVLLQGRETPTSRSVPFGCARCIVPGPLSDSVIRALNVLEADIAFRKTATTILRKRRRHSGAEHWHKAFKYRK